MGRTIGLCLPMGDTCDSEFAHDLMLATAYHAATSDDAINVHMRQGTILAEQRNELCKMAIENDATHIVFLDADQRFPKDVFERLIAHDVPVVAANIAKRRRPISPTARRERPDNPDQLEGVWPNKEVRGLERVAVVGTGVICIKTEALLQVPFPWFAQPWLEEQQRFVGEDLYLMGQFRRAGVPVYIDHDLSWEVGHLGKYEYKMDDCIAERALADAGHWDHARPDMQVA